MKSRRATRIYSLLLVLNVLLHLTIFSQDTQENANFKLAVNLYNDGMYDLAVEQFKQFISTYPNTQNGIEARFFLGLTQLKLYQFEEARIVFQTFALAYPEHVKAPEAWWKTGEAYAEMTNYKEAASAFERVKIFHPRSKIAPDALIKSSEYFKRAGDVENAGKALRALIDEYAASATVLNARLLLGALYAEEGNHQQALTEFNRVLAAEAPPELKAQALVSRGALFQLVERIEEAEKDFRQVIDNYQTTAATSSALLQLGKIQQNHSQHLEAIASFQRLIGATADVDTSLKQESLVSIGDSYMKLLDYQNALVTYESFIRSYPKNNRVSSVYLKAGQALEKQKQYARANAYYARLLRADHGPDSDRRAAYLFYARNAFLLKSYQEAVNFYTDFWERYPDEPSSAEAGFAAAQIHELELLDYPRAIRVYDRFRTAYPRHENVDDALFSIARCYGKNKQYEKAIDTYEDFLRQYPASELTGEAHRQLEIIANFELKDMDKGLEKLALLIGDVLSQKSRGELSFQLAEIYFHDLKDHLAAAHQYTNAINLGLDEEASVDAYYFRARAFHLLSSKNEAHAPKRSGLADSALVYYKAFLKLHPTSKWSEDAAYARFLLASRSKSSEEALRIAEQFLALYETSRYADDLLNGVAEKALEQGDAPLAVRLSQRVLSEYGKSDGTSRAMWQLASGYLKSGKPDSAVQVLSQYVQHYPNDRDAASALFTLATLYADSNRAAEAIPLYQTLQEKYLYTSLAKNSQIALGDAYLAAGRYDDAQEHFASLFAEVSRNPLTSTDERPAYLYRLATALLKKGAKQNARKHFLQYLSFDRTSRTAGEVYFALGTIARVEGNAQLATTFFRRASALTGESRAARETAELLFKNGQYRDAIAEFSSLAASAKGSSEKRYYQSRIIVSSLRSDDMTKARKRITAFQNLYKDAEVELAEFLYETGALQFRNRDYANAQKTFEQILKDYKGTRFLPWAHYWLGKILETTQEISEATKKFDEIIKKFPASDVIPHVHLSLGNISYNAEQYDESAKHFSFVLENAEAAPELVYSAMNNLILAYEDVGVYDAALNLTRQFIERYPNDENVIDKKVKIGVLYERLGYHDQAIVHLQSLLNFADSDLEAEIRYYIGESYYAKSGYQQAILEFLKVPYLVTKRTRIDWTANAFYMAGQSYEKMSKYDLAINMYHQIIDRPGIDMTFKAAAQKEIDRVRSLTKIGSEP
ncbi:MAG: tetratricopeptide repeat protein [Bacteroidota bacterium]